MVDNRVSPIPFTQAGLKALELESDNLAKKRLEILIRLQTAREMGDLSENGAYKAARFELGALDRRVREVNYLLRFGFVPPKDNPAIVGFGSKIIIKNSSAKTFSYLLVSKYESNPAKGRLSTESPLGRALIGHRVGDKIRFNAASGSQEFTLIKIS
jgi:transcription elongation factor GreA